AFGNSASPIRVSPVQPGPVAASTPTTPSKEDVAPFDKKSMWVITAAEPALGVKIAQLWLPFRAPPMATNMALGAARVAAPKRTAASFRAGGSACAAPQRFAAAARRSRAAPR